MSNLNLEVIYLAMEACCNEYDNVMVSCTQDDGVLLQWEYSNNGGTVMHVMEGVSKPVSERVDDDTLNAGILLIIACANKRIRGESN